MSCTFKWWRGYYAEQANLELVSTLAARCKPRSSFTIHTAVLLFSFQYISRKSILCSQGKLSWGLKMQYKLSKLHVLFKIVALDLLCNYFRKQKFSNSRTKISVVMLRNRNIQND